MPMREVSIDEYIIYGAGFSKSGKYLSVGIAYGYMLKYWHVPYICVTFRVPKQGDSLTLPPMNNVNFTVKPTRGKRVVCELSGQPITELVREVMQAVSTAEIDRHMKPIRELARQASITTKA